MKNQWTKKEQLLLDQIEQRMIADGVPEHRVRLSAEQELEKQIEYERRWE